MPGDNKKMYMSAAKSTGTIPKVKQRNNSTSGGGSGSGSAERRSNLLSNNLGNEHELVDSGTGRQSFRNHNPNSNLPFYPIMDLNQENGLSIRQNGISLVNGTVSTPTDSHPASRRNSSGLSKCDNVAKYPDKKQIENKLSQIQEYLQFATSMRANMKKTDEQLQSCALQAANESQSNNEETMDEEQLTEMISDLLDSEAKLKQILLELDNDETQFSENGSESDGQKKNELEQEVDIATRDLQMLKEQANLLLHLQLSAESQLREAKLAQAKLAKSAVATRNANLETESWYDSDTHSTQGACSRETPREPEHFQNQIDWLQNRIQQVRDGGDNRQLKQILDVRDAQLQAQHNSLQGKLQELQCKKQQVDQLAMQLQNMNEDVPEEDEMGRQVKNIVNMKEQLAKLKDMLSMVQNTECGLETNANFNDEIEENVDRLIAKTDNLMQQNRVPHVENVENATRVYPSNERNVTEKQVNKKSMNEKEKERIKLQAELHAKRKELEELMCKHKAANSNLNHEFNSEKNSEIGMFDNSSSTTNAWYPIFNARPGHSSESDADDGNDNNEYSEMNSSNELNTSTVQPMPALNYPTAIEYIRKRSQEAASPRVEMPHETASFMSMPPRSPARSVTPAYAPREPPRNQMQKQLELIKSVCDSMLDSGSNSQNNDESVPVRVRNNLTPSPIYSEPRHYSSRNPMPPNTNTNTSRVGGTCSSLNVISYPDAVPVPTSSNNPVGDPSYNNFLTTNALQTQSFILNTLNHCCQMLWHQQKELSTLRNTVQQQQMQMPVYQDEAMCMCNTQANNFRHPKMNQAPNTGSMPNLNGHHCAHSSNANATNMEHAHPACCPIPVPMAMNMSVNNQNNAHAHQHQNVEHLNLNTNNHNHVMHHNLNQNAVPTPLWNGQALNNQVAPGNRANNYWDNFRSYSRQNLFSTKSNDGSHNLHNDRSNQSSDRQRSSNELATASTSGVSSLFSNSKSNHNETIAASASSVNTPRRSAGQVVSPPERSDRTRQKMPNNDGATAFSLDSFQMETISSGDEAIGSTITNDHNEWNETENTLPKSKLFEELRENVYKEVASLISANEGRPHFLIQLFRDLQLVSSDPLRRNILQSVHSIITNSLSAASSSPRQNDANTRANENALISEENNDYELYQLQQDDAISASASDANSDNAYGTKDVLLTSVIWPMLSNHSHSINEEQEQEEQEQFHEALSTYLNIRSDDEYMDIVEQPAKLPQIPPMSTLSLYVEDEEMSRLQILMQNGDLAEADQSRGAAEHPDDDDEGAVGGLLNIERSGSRGSNAQQMHLEEDIILETEDESEQGLDQVPTRLSNPPSIGCSPKSQ